jgi:hypothetical protein
MVDVAAHLRVLAAADAWCHQLGVDAAYSYAASNYAAVTIPGEEVIATRVQQAHPRFASSTLIGVGDTGIRGVHAHPFSGRVSLVVSGASWGLNGWARVLGGFADSSADTLTIS